jgi:hypothetical protein
MTYRKQFLKKYSLPEKTSLSINDISALTGIPDEALQLVYNRGIGAWKSNPQSVRTKDTFEKDPSKPRKAKLGKEAWAMARVYAFVAKAPQVYKEADNDIREKFNLP